MKANPFLRKGIIMLVSFILMFEILSYYFEIRDYIFYMLINWVNDGLFLVILFVILLGLHKIKSKLKMLLLIIVYIFIGYVSILVFFMPKMPNSITIKQDTKILMVSEDNPSKKVIIQEYGTGLLGDFIHVDTLIVNEFNQYFRFVQKIDCLPTDSEWKKLD